MEHKSVSIVISTYNGKGLLEKYLPSVFEAARSYGGRTEVIVVDDGGEDGSDEFIQQNFPEIRLLRLQKNMGPILAINEGFRASKNEIIILLNNDILLASDFIRPLSAHFNDKNVFGVFPNLHLLDKKDMRSYTMGLLFRRGFIETPPFAPTETEGQNIIFLLGGGAAAIDRDKLLQLGGFDELLSPFYWEDVDLSYRAWKRGWKILYEPKSLLYHEIHSTISKEHKSDYVDKISERNRYIIFWKNISDKRLLISHFLWIPLRLVRNILTGKWGRVTALFLALSKVKQIMRKRHIELQETKTGDDKLFKLFSEIMKKSPYEFALEPNCRLDGA